MKKINFYLGPMVVGTLLVTGSLTAKAQTVSQNATVIENQSMYSRTTTVETKEIYPYSQSITIKGSNSSASPIVITGNLTTKKLQFTLNPSIDGSVLHSKYQGELATVQVLSSNAQSVKSKVTINGNQRLQDNMDLQYIARNGMSFQIGDVLKLTHRNSEGGRLLVGSTRLNAVEYFKFTADGLERIGKPTITAEDITLIQGATAPNALQGIEVIDPFTNQTLTPTVVRGSVNTSETGDYEYTYQVTTSVGQVYTFTRTFHVEYPNEIIIKGYGSESYAKFDFNTATKKIMATALRNGNVHYVFNEYASVAVMDSTYRVLDAVTINGKQALSSNPKFMDMTRNGMSVEYGNIIQVKHEEPKARLEITGFESEPFSKVNYFEVTPEGLQPVEVTPTVVAKDFYLLEGSEQPDELIGLTAIDPFTNEDLPVTKVSGVMNTEVTGYYTYWYKVITSDGAEHRFSRKFHVVDKYPNEITIKGYSTWDYLGVKLNPVTQKITFRALHAGQVHWKFNDEYAAIKLMDENFKEKESLVIKGIDKMTEQAEVQKLIADGGMDYQIGDILQIRHKEASDRLLITGLTEPVSTVNNFRITENGLVKLDSTPKITVPHIRLKKGDAQPTDLNMEIQVIDPFTGKDISDTVKNTSGKMDTSVTGYYTFWYEVTTKDGTVHKFSRRFYVDEPLTPILPPVTPEQPEPPVEPETPEQPEEQYPHDIVVKTSDGREALKLTFDIQNQKVIFTDLLKNEYLSNPSDDSTYITISLVNDKLVDKTTITLKGNQTLSDNVQLQQLISKGGLSFVDGDSIHITQPKGASRFEVSDWIYGYGESNYYLITPEGLE